MFLEKLKHPSVACLSILILAICSLMLLPIEGYCEWTYQNEGYSSFSDSHSESHRGGWTLSGSVSAGSSNASAYMGPSISNPTAFNGALYERVADYKGSATVEASREECTVEGYVPCDGFWCTLSHFGFAHDHWKAVTIPAKTDSGNESFLQAWVLMVREQFKRVYGVQVSDPTIKLTISVNLGDDRAKTGAEWTSGGKLYKTEYSTIVTKAIPQVQPSKSASAHVNGPAEANKSASCVDFDFAGNSYDSADASYTPSE